MTSLKEKLYQLVKEKQYLSYGDLCQFVAYEGYKVETATRRMRELCALADIEPVMKKSKRNTDYISAYMVKSNDFVGYPDSKLTSTLF